MKRLNRFWTAAFVLSFVLVAAGAFSVPFGEKSDEALFIVLARALRGGSFAVPGPFGWTVTDPWPGFPLLISFPDFVFASHWPLYRLLGLFFWAAFVWGVWRLARRCAGSDAAAAAALLAGLSPAIAGQAGLMTPDLAFAALVAISLAYFAEDGPAAAWALPAGLAALMRPHGCLLLATFFAVSLARNNLKSTRAALAAGIPVCLFLARDRLVAGTLTDYATHWSAQSSAGPFARAANLFTTIFSDGLLGFFFLPRAGSFVAGVAAVAAGAWALRRWAKSSREPGPLAAAVFAAAVVVLHLGWTTAVPRYAAPLAPIFWTALAAAAGRKKAAVVPAAFALAAALFFSAQRAAGLASATEIVEPRTMAWIAAHTPGDARFASFAAMPIRLLTNRDAATPRVASRDAWVAWLLRGHIDYVHVFGLRAEGYFPDPARRLASSMESWARSLSFLIPVYEDREEQCAIFRVAHPDPKRFLAAWDAFLAAGDAARGGAPAAEVERGLDRALALEPTLALAWGARGSLETDPRRRLSDFKKAASSDPTSSMIRQDLEAAESSRSPR